MYLLCIDPESSSSHNAHTPISLGTSGQCSEVYAVTKTFAIGPPGTSTNYLLSGGCPGTTAIYASRLSVTLTAFVPDRMNTYLFVPGDYSGIYNVTDPAGNVVSRRYVGEPRFVALVLNVSSWDAARGCWCGPGTPSTVLVPRSVFFQTRLYAYLNASSPVAPLDKLTFRQNSTTASSNADDIQEILSGNVTGPEFWGYLTGILDLIRLNATGAWILQQFDLGNDLLLYTLPDNAIRLSAYRPPYTTASAAYAFCSSGCYPPPKPWWEQIWDGIVSTVVGFVTSAFVFAVNAFAKLVEVLGQVGAWVSDLVSGDPARVARAVRAAAKVVEQIGQWVVNALSQIAAAILDPLLSPIARALQQWGNALNARIRECTGASGCSASALASILGNVVLGGSLLLALLATVGAIALIETATKPILGIAFELTSILIDIVVGLIVGALVSLLIPAAYGGSQVLSDLIPPSVNGGIAAAFGAIEFSIAFGAYLATQTRTLKSLSFIAPVGLAVAIAGLLVLTAKALVTKETKTDSGPRILFDLMAISLVSYAAISLEIPGPIKRWYKLLWKVNEAFDIIGLVASFTELVRDVKLAL